MRVKGQTGTHSVQYQGEEVRSSVNGGQFSDPHRRDLGNVRMWLLCKVKEKCLPEACSRLYSQSAFKVCHLFRGQAVLLLLHNLKGQVPLGIQRNGVGGAKMKRKCAETSSPGTARFRYKTPNSDMVFRVL